MTVMLGVIVGLSELAAAAVEKPVRPPPPSVPEGSNPLVALASAAVGAILYVLGLVQYGIALVTIEVPTRAVRMLQYSLTISVGFPHFAALFVGLLGAIFFVVRYRYLTRYTKLKEDILPPPSPPTLTNSLPLLADAVLTDPSKRPSNPLHSYLDDFLSAIRIFGYLEKPVFHELSRHLQTRRLAAGETIEIGDGDFWCVVEGRVQVFAPSSDVPRSPDPFEASSFNGYNLINEVSTGGTLSSLFSILSLFTEHIKLPWASEEDASDDSIEEPRHFHRSSRANSDVSQLDGRMMGMTSTPASTSPAADASPTQTQTSLSTEATETPDVQSPMDDEITPSVARGRSFSFNSTNGQRAWSPGRSSGEVERKETMRPAQSASQPTTAATSPSMPAESKPIRRADTPAEPNARGSAPNSIRVGTSSAENAMKGTIARAAVDSTLAVIPASAFKKLTRNFPKSTGAIVQVVLERFSRVTFMTAHKFFGLTKEILRSEATLNELVSYPLPRQFYTGGGMQALRRRFQTDRNNYPDSSPTRSKDDYFNFEPPSPSVTAPSMAGTTPGRGRTPAAKAPRKPQVMTEISANGGSDSNMVDADGDMTVGSTATRGPSERLDHASQQRQKVAVGDLAVSQGPNVGEAFYRPAKTPGLNRTETWRDRMSSTSLSKITGKAVLSEDIEDEEDLRDALVNCMAMSIGLMQPPDEPSNSYPSQSASMSISARGSPMLFPSGRPQPGGLGRAPFHNVLDMMNASTPESKNVGGLLRESLFNARMEDDEASSVSASMPGSSFAGGMNDVNFKILRDLGNHLDVLHYKKGSTLVKEGETETGLYYVIDGFLDVSIPVARAGTDPSADTATVSAGAQRRPFGSALGHDDAESPLRPFGTSQGQRHEHLFTVKPGGLAGYLSSLCSNESYVNITAKTDCFVGYLPHHALESIMERRPIVLLTLSKRLLSLLSPLILHIDAGLDWIQLDAGQLLFEKGDKARDFYIVINGRLRSVVQKGASESVEVLREYGQNDSIGELDVMTGVPRSDTVQAIRESELVRIPAALFDAISTRHPATTVQFMRLIASDVRKAVVEHRAHRASNTSQELRADRNLKTVCIIGTNRNVPVAQFASKLKASLEGMGAPASYLDQATVVRHLGRHAFTRMGALKIAGWLADQEQQHRVVLYVADTPPSSQWTMTCIRQADLVLVLGMGDDPSLGEYEKLLLAMKSFARKELILLHDERAVPAGSTRLWLKNRPWLQAHYHVELPGVITGTKPGKVHDPAAIAAFKHLRERVETQVKKYRGVRPLVRPRRPPHMDDFARIARRLCGKQVGLVLGGGGGRGISHIGMLQALEEYGIPVDAVAGCSIGAFVGGLYSRETDLLQTTGRTRQFAGRMASVLRMLSDVTYPFVAYTTGHEFNRGIYKAFSDSHIEDFWIPFYCNSTNITHSRMEIHRSGYAWRFVRASMTLAGLLPPLSDHGELLVDGGYMDNTPIGPLRQSGIRDIFVVDVGSIDDTSARHYGDSVSGWWLALNRLNPFSSPINVPSMTEISSRLTYVSSVKTLEDVKTDPHCLYIAMPVQQFDTIGGFKQFSAVREIGLEAARKQLRLWAAEGRLPHGLVEEQKRQVAAWRGQRLRRMSI